MRILFTQSYFLILDPKHYKEAPYPPLGTLYAATLLKEAGHTIYFFDAMLSSPSEFRNFFARTQVDLLVVYDDEFNYVTKMCLSNMREAGLDMIEQATARGIPSVMYSSDAIDHPELFLDKGCMVVIHGEGETALSEIIEAQETDHFEKERHRITGVSFYEDGTVVRTAKRQHVKELDEIPAPDWELVDLKSYADIWRKKEGYFSINISTTRGCPYQCNWCSKPLFGQSYRVRSPEKVAKEFKILKDRYGVDHIWITDDIFGLKGGWLQKFSDICKKEKITVPYKCLSRADLIVKNKTAHHLKESGCQTVWIGAESGSQKILDAMDKGITIEQTMKAALQLKENGIRIGFFLQFGYLGELWSDIQLTRKLIRTCLPDEVGVSVTYPLPGTKFYEKVKHQVEQKKHWTDSSDLAMLFSGTYPPQFYRILHHLIHAEHDFYQCIHKNSWKKIHQTGAYFFKFMRHTLSLTFFQIQQRFDKAL